MSGKNPISIVISSALEKLIGSRGSQTMTLSASEQLRNQLRPNMLITGTVTANLGQGKYNVKFMKESAVIESKTPLSVNELLHGRVVGVGDKIELQRVFKEKAGANNQSAKQANWEQLISGGNQGTRAVEVLTNYRVSLTLDEQLTLSAMLKTTNDTEAMILSSIVLNKMGLMVTPEALNMLYPILSRTLSEKFNLHNITAHLDFEKVTKAASNSKNISEIARYVAHVVNNLPESEVQNDKNNLISALQSESAFNATDMGDSGAQHDRDSEYDALLFDAKRMLLNTQSDGAVSHRISVVPFLINDKLVEVDMALFSQRQKQHQHASIEYKKVALSLDLDVLGRVDVQINMANKNTRVGINAENNLISNEMVKYMSLLKKDFGESGFRLDELSYGAIEKDKLGNVIGSVVDHYISQDSLNRVY